MSEGHIIDVNTSSRVPDTARGAVVAIGNFDGVHRGHAAVLGLTRKVAAQSGTVPGVLTFEPHPRHYFQPHVPLLRLTPQADKVARLTQAGMKTVFVYDFNADLANMTAEDFVDTVLIKQLGVRAVVIGPDFHFGKGRTGNADTIRAAGIHVHVMPQTCDEAGETISATRIRTLLQQGDIAGANALLG
ncbi:MAG: hypothetical protein V4621_04465 [Pseudomonadota bacterium]